MDGLQIERCPGRPLSTAPASRKPGMGAAEPQRYRDPLRSRPVRRDEAEALLRELKA
ncbi:hypothetical protein HMPREF9057_03095, partial [Actinomyces sp. oral taxon 171 str. F0337]